MRYVFSQLLELQNDLNRKIDYDKVETVVDGLLEELEKAVRRTPSKKKYSVSYIIPKDDTPIDFVYLTASELDLILREFKSLGFNNVTIQDDFDKLYGVSSLYIVFSWE